MMMIISVEDSEEALEEALVLLQVLVAAEGTDKPMKKRVRDVEDIKDLQEIMESATTPETKTMMKRDHTEVAEVSTVELLEKTLEAKEGEKEACSEAEVVTWAVTSVVETVVASVATVVASVGIVVASVVATVMTSVVETVVDSVAIVVASVAIVVASVGIAVDSVVENEEISEEDTGEEEMLKTVITSYQVDQEEVEVEVSPIMMNEYEDSIVLRH